MLNLNSDVEGKKAFYGDIRKPFEKEGFTMCGGWEYDHTHFDAILYQDGGVTIYLRLPAHVIQGKLDHEDACLQFGRPFVIKHVVHTGLVEDDFQFTILDATGLSQFQPPLDPDDKIEREDKWTKAGERALNRIKQYVQ